MTHRHSTFAAALALAAALAGLLFVASLRTAAQADASTSAPQAAGKAASPAGQPWPPARPLVGAIRWDAWTDWGLYAKALAPKKWHYRLPFYARVLGDNSVVVRDDNLATINKEIAYAHRAGLNYWAWCWYDPTDIDATKHHMNKCLDIYRSSPDRDEINYCIIAGSYWATRHWPKTVALYVSMFKEPNYQKVLGNRPLLYYFMADAMVSHFGSAAKAHAALDLLREKTVAAGLGAPYVVALCFWPDKGAKAADECGFDAIGSYCNPGGAEGKQLPYADLAGLNRWFWNECKKTGKEVVPPVNSGWDYRPLISPEFPKRNPKGNWYTTATPAQLAAHVGEAMRWVHDNPKTCPADTVLIYAWDEFAEGGWICPTLEGGAARLDAIAKVLAGGWRQG